MKSEILPELRRLIQEELRGLRTAELAVVQAQHPHESDSDTDNYALSVRLRDTEGRPFPASRGGVIRAIV